MDMYTGACLFEVAGLCLSVYECMVRREAIMPVGVSGLGLYCVL